jgi:hypothetical protein
MSIFKILVCVYSVEFTIKRSGFRLGFVDPGSRVRGLRFRVWNSGFRV